MDRPTSEYDAMFVAPVDVLATPRELYENLRDIDRIVLSGEHDVFGDRRVRIIPAPGHTPGSIESV